MSCGGPVLLKSCVAEVVDGADLKRGAITRGLRSRRLVIPSRRGLGGAGDVGLIAGCLIASCLIVNRETKASSARPLVPAEPGQKVALRSGCPEDLCLRRVPCSYHQCASQHIREHLIESLCAAEHPRDVFNVGSRVFLSICSRAPCGNRPNGG